MAKYEVLRTFPAKETIQRGQVIESPTFKNLEKLVRTGYLREIADEILPETENVSAQKLSKPKKGAKNGSK